MKQLTISPKDSTSKITLDHVESFYQEGLTLAVVFNDGTVRNYPLCHIWYYSSK